MTKIRVAIIPDFVVILTLLVFAGCAHWHPTLRAEGEVPFSMFIQSVRDARFDAFAKAPGAFVENPTAFDEMKAHILSLYQGVTPAHTFIGRDQQFVDCVPIEQQPGLRNPRTGPLTLAREAPAPSAIAAAPELPGRRAPPAMRKTADVTLKRGIVDRFGRGMYCEPGTIPMRRVTLDEMVRFRTLAEFLSKGGLVRRDQRQEQQLRPELIPGDPDHYYAVGTQTVANFGGDSWLNLWNPRVSTHQFSLSQMWVRANPDASRQTIEAGWQVYPDRWSTTQAALFIYHTTNNYAPGTGCYNLTCAGFVQIANNVYLGSGFDNYSDHNGTQWGFNLQVKRHTDGNWWLFYRGPGDYIAVGYFPGILWGSGEMSRQASRIRWGGETTGDPSACEMGSGAFPAEGWGQAAYHDVVFYIDTNTVSQWPTLSEIETPTDCYLIDLYNFDVNGEKTYFYFGGPKCR